MTNDVTAGYIVNDVERLRKPMEEISAQLLRHFEINEEKKILKFPAHQKEPLNIIFYNL